VVFGYWPFLSALRLAFYRNNGLGLNEFVGLGNFAAILGDSLFWRSFGILGIFIVLVVPLATIGPLLGAKLVSSVRNTRWGMVYRTVFVLPLVVPMVVGVLIWRQLYSTDGAINRLLELIGMGGIAQPWLGDPGTVIPAIVFMGVPFVGGVHFLIYLAGYLGISRSLYEAAWIEGASPWTIFSQVELPCLRPQLRLILVLSVIGTLHGYEHILVLTNGGPGNATLVPALYLFRHGFEWGNLGIASAVGCLLFALAVGLTALNFRLLRSRED
jgi:ABC-type sugar transport system permease subunit